MKKQEPTVVIDGTNLLLGRIATVAAKHALLGESVAICNCAAIMMTGSKNNIMEKYRGTRVRGQPTKGPFLHRGPDRFVRRVVRGMLPYKKPRGAEAFKRVMCYRDLPEEWKAKVKPMEEAHIKKVKSLKRISVGEICKELGGK